MWDINHNQQIIDIHWISIKTTLFIWQSQNSDQLVKILLDKNYVPPSVVDNTIPVPNLSDADPNKTRKRPNYYQGGRPRKGSRPFMTLGRLAKQKSTASAAGDDDDEEDDETMEVDEDEEADQGPSINMPLTGKKHLNMRVSYT